MNLGWRRRSDGERESVIIEEPIELLAELRENNARHFKMDEVLTKEIEKYARKLPSERSFDNMDFKHSASHSYDDYEPYKDIPDTIETPHIQFNEEIPFDGYEKKESLDKFDDIKKDFSAKSHNFDEKSASEDQYSVTPYPSAPNDENKLRDLIPENQKNKYPVEVEEITYEEFIELQKLGDTFEEPLDEYEDIDQHTSIDFNGYSDQLSFGTNNNYVRIKYDGPQTKDNILPEKSKETNKEMRVLTLQNEAGKLNVLNPKNEIGFSTHDGFKTMPMTFKHESDPLYDNKPFESLGLWEIAEDGKIKENYYKNIANPFLDSHSLSNYRESKLSNHDAIFNDPTFTQDSLKNTNSEVSEAKLNFPVEMSDSDTISYDQSKTLKLGQSPPLESELWNKIEIDGKTGKQKVPEIDNRMDYGDIDYYFLEDIVNDTKTPIKFETSKPEVIKNINQVDDKEKVETLLQKINDGDKNNGQYYDELLAIYDYDDFTKEAVKESDKIVNETKLVSDDGPNHTKYDFVEPKPVYIVYPVTASITTVNNLTETTTLPTTTSTANKTTTEYTLDYNNFI